jgi:hypothetical protein
MAMGGFERVRQDEHEDVYCNGARHVALFGDQFGLSPRTIENKPATIRIEACNCTPHRFERVPA